MRDIILIILVLIIELLFASPSGDPHLIPLMLGNIDIMSSDATDLLTAPRPVVYNTVPVE
jgi:hypothetical protein